ncbi:hypothetical protein B0T20DRAFT_18309 [Sordaria brevicollis]|uniref:Uncharacterized protein n=1 Tax=Sordaria brevicollis TaxID=83679 RepID=A0AAE0UGQ6_SORBR|nr:hypothetical protein B0T20DRAFT_18309 [Sordaria brevicollis]
MDITVCTCAALLYMLGPLGARYLHRHSLLAWYRLYSRQPCICSQILAAFAAPREYLLRQRRARICCRGLSCMFSLPSGMPEDGPLLDAVVPSVRRQVGSFSLAEAELAVGSSAQLQGEERKKKREQRAGWTLTGQDSVSCVTRRESLTHLTHQS